MLDTDELSPLNNALGTPFNDIGHIYLGCRQIVSALVRLIFQLSLEYFIDIYYGCEWARI